jgi:hypothetical protein
VSEFRVTFGQKYAREVHPTSPDIHPDGWVAVHAADYAAARLTTVATFGTAWANLYTPDAMPAEEWALYFPRGELASITSTAPGSEVTS